MSTTGIDEVRTKLKDLISQLGPDDEVVITENSQPIARLLAPKPCPQCGGCKGMLTIVQDDDEHLEDFKDYMP